MTFVIAEIGINWDGNLELAREMVSRAKSAGCDAVKFQAFNKPIVEKHPEWERLLKSSITKNNIDEINKIAKTYDIEWFCTPMYVEAVDLLNPYVNRFKIRELDGRPLLENKTSELIERVFDTGKKAIISAAKSPKSSIFYNKPQISWLSCVPKYPCQFSDLDFVDINEFDGFSNHCPHFMSPLTAVTLGASIIEVHITSDKKNNFIDNNVSFDYKELEELVNLIRISESIKKSTPVNRQ